MRSSPVLLALVTLCLVGSASIASAASDPWNRRVEGIAVAPSLSGKSEVRVVWSALLGKQTSFALDLSTDVLVRVGNQEYVQQVKVVADAGAGFCADGNCGGSCGSGAVNGMAAALLCLADGGGCACKFPPITTEVPIELKPGDVITVLLLPSAGALPETQLGDDLDAVVFDGDAIFWDRKIVGVTLEPVVGVEGVFDVAVDYETAVRGGVPMAPDLSLQFELSVNGVKTLYELPCGPWLLDPSSELCHPQLCDNQICATISCNGSKKKLRCKTYENDWGLFGCACVSDVESFRIANVKLAPSDKLSVALIAAPGALPELKGIAADTFNICGATALSTPYGVGKAGSHGVPSLVSTAPPVLGQVSGITMKSALPGATPILAIGLSAASLAFDGGTLLVAPVVILAVPVPVAQNGSLTLEGPTPMDPTLCGVAIYYQMLVPDPGAAGYYHVALTNGLRRVFGS